VRHAKELTQKSKAHEIKQLRAFMYEVTSGSSGKTYVVCLNETGPTCTCDWAKYRKWSDRRSACSHTLAVYRWLAKEQGGSASAWGTMEGAKRQHRRRMDIGDGVVLTLRRAG